MRAFRFCLITRESLPAGKRKTVKKAEKYPAIDGFIKNQLTNKHRCPALARYEICHLIRHYVNLIIICIVSLIHKSIVYEYPKFYKKFLRIRSGLMLLLPAVGKFCCRHTLVFFGTITEKKLFLLF